MLYQWYELSRAAMRPARVMAGSGRLIFNNPFNPLAYTVSGRHAAAACEVFERTTRRYKKPTFRLVTTTAAARTARSGATRRRTAPARERTARPDHARNHADDVARRRTSALALENVEWPEK